MAKRLRPVGDWIAGRFEIFAVHPGGMGVVYVAHDHLGPPGRSVVAIKTLRDEWLLDDEWKARFVAEGDLWVALGSHPNIVHAHSVEMLDGKPHILLELVTGGDLRKRIGSPELDTLRTIQLGIQFCLGMEHAIRQGLRCHRDVKPGNLMIAGDGTLKITDFGLAVIRDEACADAPRSFDGPIPLDDVTTTGLINFDDPTDGTKPPPGPIPGDVRTRPSTTTVEPARPPVRRRADPPADPDRVAPRDAPLHGPRAVPRPEVGRCPGGHLRIRGRPLRDADRQAPLPRGDDRPPRPRPLELRPALRRPRRSPGNTPRPPTPSTRSSSTASRRTRPIGSRPWTTFAGP